VTLPWLVRWRFDEPKDPTLLERIKTGDKVRFHADAVGGAFTVMRIERAN